VVMELERQRDPVLLVGHQGVLRILYSYFMGLERERAPFISVPSNTVICLVPGTYVCSEERICLIPGSEEGPPSY
jgi:broad specificity phosphatase PhoE